MTKGRAIDLIVEKSYPLPDGGAGVRLMYALAAAPDLLEALEGFVEIWEGLSEVYPTLGDEKILSKSKQAIAKAKGERI